ncbi:MAG: hypothetical protein AB7G37_19100, partial [Solirubrobacteraceae bacterium]
MSRSIRDPFGRRSATGQSSAPGTGADEADGTSPRTGERPSLDPVLAALVAGVVVVGAGIYLWGGGQDTEPVLPTDPTAALSAPAQDATTKRALAVARSIDVETADPEADGAERLADALDA